MFSTFFGSRAAYNLSAWQIPWLLALFKKYSKILFPGLTTQCHKSLFPVAEDIFQLISSIVDKMKERVYLHSSLMTSPSVLGNPYRVRLL